MFVDGVNVRDLDPDTLWSRIGLVPQRPYLFAGTVASNLRYGKPDATDDELWEALRIAQARAVQTFPAGSDSGSRSPGHWSSNPKYTFSTTPSPRWTVPPTPDSGWR